MEACEYSGPSSMSCQRFGHSLLTGLLIVGLSLVLLMTWKAPSMLFLIPSLLLGGTAVWYIFRHPLLNLCLVLSSFVLIADFEAGIQPTEILYGLYYLGFLAHWFIKRLFLECDNPFRRSEERVLFAFLVLISLSIAVTFLFGGTLRLVMGEWLSLSLLAFYYPIKDAVERYPKGLYAMIGVLVWIGLFILARNVLNYQNIIQNATYAWQVTRGRAVTNESLLMVPAFFSLAAFLFSQSWKSRILTAILFLAFFVGLILTQSRGYWVAFFVGVGLMFYLVSPRQRVQLIMLGGVSVLGVVSVGVILFGDYVLLILSGLFNRLLSIGTSITQDQSLVNRFLETGAVWEHIKTNPVLGYGMGVPFRFYDINFQFSHLKTFIHNGYVALWYKFGIWGLGMMLFYLGKIVTRSIRSFRSRDVDISARLASLAIAASFAAFSLTAITSNPFYINDTMFIFALLAGIAGGCSGSVVSRG